MTIMKYITLSLLIGFVAIGTFGFGFMNHDEGHITSNCIASVIDKVTCLQSDLAVALHHINAYQTFSQATPSSFYISLALILGLFVVGYIFLKNLLSKNLLTPSPQLLRHKQNEPELYLHQSRKIIKWLSLFESSPSLFYTTP